MSSFEEMHELITTKLGELYKLYNRMHNNFEEEGYGEQSHMLTITLMTFPFTGKEELSEEEIAEACSEIQKKLFSLN